MKTILFITIFVFSLKSFGQIRPTYELMLDISGITNHTPPKADEVVGQPLPSLSNTREVNYAQKLTAGFTVGGRLSYSVYKELSMSIGGSVSYFSVSRDVNTDISGSLFKWNRFEAFEFWTINLPVNLCLRKDRWEFEAGIIPSVIVSSKRSKDQAFWDLSEFAYDGQPPLENKKKAAIGLSISPNYAITKKIRIGIEYVHGISSLIDSYNTPEIRTRAINLKILYKL